MGSYEQNISMKLKKKILTGGGGMFDNGNVNRFMLWRAFFSVEPGIFVSNRAFLSRTMHFAVELGFFVSNESYNFCYPEQAAQ